MLPFVPGPGTPPFTLIVGALHPFGISPEGITVDAPSSKMGDVVVSIALPEKRLAIRITAAFLELRINGLFVGDETDLVAIIEPVLDAIRSIDSTALPGTISHRVTSHLELIGTEIENFLGEHQVPQTVAAGLIADAIAYRVKRRENIRASEIRFVLAKSVVSENALFIDMNATYSEIPDISTVATWMNSDFDATLELLGLVEKASAE